MKVETKYFGAVECPQSLVIKFPLGLPGFECLTDFLCLEQPALRPLVYLQSVAEPQVCFLTLPARVIEPSYQLAIENHDAQILELGAEAPQIGSNIACIAILCTGPDRVPSANLAAPVVINIARRIGLQIVQIRSEYDCAHPLGCVSSMEAAC